jgi:hypothetical protein
MTVREGDRLPALALADIRGSNMELAGLRGEATLLISLRHLA